MLSQFLLAPLPRPGFEHGVHRTQCPSGKVLRSRDVVSFSRRFFLQDGTVQANPFKEEDEKLGQILRPAVQLLARIKDEPRHFDGEVEVINKDGKLSFDAEVQVITLGNELAWVGLPGEMFVELGLALEEASPFQYTMVHTLANGAIGYVPNRRAYPEGAREAEATRCAPGSGERLIEAATRLLIQCKNDGQN